MANYADPELSKLDDLLTDAIRMQVKYGTPEADKMVMDAMDALGKMLTQEPWRAVGQTEEQYKAGQAE